MIIGTSNFVHVFQDWFGYFESLSFPYEFCDQFVNSKEKKGSWNIDVNFIDLWTNLSIIDILTYPVFWSLARGVFLFI